MRPTSVEESVLRVKEAADRMRARLEAAGRYSREARSARGLTAETAETPAFFGSSGAVGATECD